MLQPARTKYRKQQKGRNTGVATRGAKVSFGDFGLKATERGRLTARQIEAARRAMTRHIKRGGRIWIRIFRTSLFPVNPPKFGWVTVRATPSTLWPKSCPARCSTKWMVWMKSWPVRHLPSRQPSYLWPPPLLPVIWDKAMKAKELRTKNVEELNQELVSLLKARFGLKMQLSTQQSTKTSELGKLRRDIARVKTLIREKAV